MGLQSIGDIAGEPWSTNRRGKTERGTAHRDRSSIYQDSVEGGYLGPTEARDRWALALGMANVMINENLLDKEFIQKWTVGFDKLRPRHGVSAGKSERDHLGACGHDTGSSMGIATHKPATLWEGNGLDQHTNVVQTVRALCILRAITGNLDVRGSCVWDPEGFDRRKTRNMNPRPEDWQSIEKLFSRSIAQYLFQYKAHGCRTVDAARSLETGGPYRIRAMMVQGGDPLISLSNQRRIEEALRKLEFLAVHDIFMTLSAEIADLVLPAATFLERTMLVKYLFESEPRVDTNLLGLQDKVVEPLGECKSDIDFLCDLGRKMGYKEYFPWRNVEEAINDELEPVGLTVEDLRKRGGVVSRKYDLERLYGKYVNFCSGLPTQKIELYSKVFEQRGQDPLPTYREPAESPISRPDLARDYPVIGQVGIKPGLFTHGQYRTLPWLREIMPEPWAEINSGQAERLGIRNGRQGCCRISQGQHRGQSESH